MLVSWGQVLTDGLVFTGVMAALLVLSLVINPRMWLHDYPADIRKNAPPLTAGEKRVRNMVLLPFMIGMFVLPYVLARNAALSSGSVGFLPVFAHLWIILNLFNLFDAVVLDVLFLGMMRPKFALIPEAWDHPDLLNVRREAGNWVKGVVICTIIAAIMAGAVVITLG